MNTLRMSFISVMERIYPMKMTSMIGRLAKAQERGMVVGAGDLENETGEEIGQKHEKSHRKREPQDERDRGEDVHGVDLELLPNPLVELGGLGVVAEDLGRAHEHSHAHEELRDKIDHPSHEGHLKKTPRREASLMRFASTVISPDSVRTAVAMEVRPFIMTPSSTACPPM